MWKRERNRETEKGIEREINIKSVRGRERERKERQRDVNERKKIIDIIYGPCKHNFSPRLIP
mgnify:CR=1 FL=1